MSSISFPDRHANHQGQDGNDSQYYSPSYDPSSSFHMNPLSAHPPRTPRTSIISTTTQIYGSSIYEPKDEAEQATLAEDVELDDETEETVKVAEAHISREEIWREMFLTSNGRDKAFVSRINAKDRRSASCAARRN